MALLQQGENKEAAEIRDSLLNGYPDDRQAALLASVSDARLNNLEADTVRLEILVEKIPNGSSASEPWPPSTWSAAKKKNHNHHSGSSRF